MKGRMLSVKNAKEERWKPQFPTKSLAFYKFVVDSVPSGVITVDRDLRITGFNHWAARLTGYSAGEAVGTFCGEILQGGMCDTRCPLRIALTSQEPRAGYPLTLELAAAKLPKRSWVKISQVRTLSTERLGKRLGRASDEELAQVLDGLLEIVG